MDLEEQFDNLEMAGDEEEDIDMDQDGLVQQDGRMDLCLVGRFLTDRSINFNAMSSRLSEIWKPGKGVHIKHISEQRFLFQFFHQVDVNSVLAGGPWVFDNCLLLYQRLQSGMVPTSVPLFHIEIWVQVYDVPVGYMSEGVGKLLGNFIGVFFYYDSKNSASLWRSYMRIRVKMDVRFLLKRFKKIKVSGGVMARVNFKYERLLIFCFVCGFLGHTKKFCPKLFSLHDEKVEIKRD
ncbi:hypothetical protein PTKIN_Ptkin03bG0193900 [Pterospermum kingtungense]